VGSHWPSPSSPVWRTAAPLSALAAEVHERGLSALDSEDPAASLPAVLSWSYRDLTPAEVKAFVLLGIAPASDIGLSGAAVLLGLSQDDARTLLRRLEHSSLPARDTGDLYRAPALIRRYAVSAARRQCTPRQTM